MLGVNIGLAGVGKALGELKLVAPLHHPSRFAHESRLTGRVLPRP